MSCERAHKKKKKKKKEKKKKIVTRNKKRRTQRKQQQTLENQARTEELNVLSTSVSPSLRIGFSNSVSSNAGRFVSGENSLLAFS
jgi:hypothetical protein